MDLAVPITQKPSVHGVFPLTWNSCGQSKSKLLLFVRLKTVQNSEDDLK